ncbi:MAG: DUF4394 domain-containing protein [Labilithrix sp.]|nr:DUF4394 domain-containing protein [Labilithrix sp.]
MKRAIMAAAVALAAATAACSSDEDAGGPGATDPTPGSGAAETSPGGGTPGAIPKLDFDAGASAPDPDAGPKPGDPDAAPNPVPPEPDKRTIWAVDSARHLLRVLAEDPADVIDVAAIDLPAGEQVLGVDFRPANGGLYAITSASRIYTIDLVTAKATAVGGETTPRVQGQSYGFDFNPVADKIRIHSDVDQNLRIDPVTGAVVGTDAMLAFAPDDVHFGQSPNLVGTAYTNSVAPTPATTTLYAIDSTRDLLVRVAPPNEGLVTTIGPLGIDIRATAGFDIWGSDGALEAYAAVEGEGATGSSLYQIDLDTGAATLVGAIAHPRPILGIAVRP